MCLYIPINFRANFANTRDGFLMINQRMVEKTSVCVCVCVCDIFLWAENDDVFIDSEIALQ